MTGSTEQYLPYSHYIAPFEMGEVRGGRHVGTGGFCNVHEVSRIVPTNDNKSYSRAETCNREFIKSTTKRKNGERRYVIKTIKPEKMSSHGAHADLQMEASLLSTIRHPNIIRLRGISRGVATDIIFTILKQPDEHFIILDRLKDTVRGRIASTWKRELQRLTHPNLLVGLWNHERIAKRKQQVLLERLTAALDIASALTYLHEHGFIYRDLKSNNCGFDEKNVCKLFDFGLARPLPEDEFTMNDTFKMSGKAGTTRYMAPEVFKCEPYGLKADVFSFAHLLWEILSCEVPYANYNRHDYKYRVVKRGIRPVIDASWPVEIQDLLEQAWAADMDERPTMKQVYEVLINVIDNIKASCHHDQRQWNRKVVQVSPEPIENSTASPNDKHARTVSKRIERPRSVRHRLNTM